MRTELEIKNRLEELEAEPILRFNPQIGAGLNPSSIIEIITMQEKMKTEIEILKWVLGQGEHG